MTTGGGGSLTDSEGGLHDQQDRAAGGRRQFGQFLEPECQYSFSSSLSSEKDRPGQGNRTRITVSKLYPCGQESGQLLLGEKTDSTAASTGITPYLRKSPARASRTVR